MAPLCVARKVGLAGGSADQGANVKGADMTTRRVSAALPLTMFVGILVGCGGGTGTGSTRDSGQSSLMDQTVAGKNKCNPKAHDRPFVIEWDATDMSSFEARASADVIVVKYEGCDMKVLDSCVNDSVKGSIGSYKPVDWTSGSLEVIDIKSDADLYAKLPLGAATIGGRVESGEQFHMEYFVSGTRAATRDAVYAADLDKIPGCKGATHFVYAFNLGAFALGSQSKIKGEVGGSYFGFGAGGSKSSENKAEKSGGVLASCRAAGAKESQTCTVPIRLTLREISDSANPDAAAATAPESDAALNLAGKLKADSDKEKKAAEHYDTAVVKMRAGDGKGCLAEFDEHDKLDPRPAGMSTNFKSWTATLRGQCIMLAGQCDAGKQFIRKAIQGTSTGGPELIDRQVETAATTYCKGKLTPRDELLQAAQVLNKGAFEKTDAASCAKAYATVKRLSPTVKPTGDDDYALAAAGTPMLIGTAPKCFVKAGDCASGRKVYLELTKKQQSTQLAQLQLSDDIIKTNFDSINASCKGK